MYSGEEHLSVHQFGAYPSQAPTPSISLFDCARQGFLNKVRLIQQLQSGLPQRDAARGGHEC